MFRDKVRASRVATWAMSSLVQLLFIHLLFSMKQNEILNVNQG